MSEDPAIENLTRAECEELLAGESMGRVVFHDRALPAVVPVSFIVDGDAVVVRTSPTGRLARATRDAVVAFQVDDLRADTGGWSVVVTGVAREVRDEQELQRLDVLLQTAAPGPRHHFIRIPLTVVSGRRLPARRLALVGT